ncbi:MAG: ribonuclease HII, partial [Candidatus Aenigmarchaeota archaeon]|nr:ribonuclease HII [Candidatus Aenigmarchaeota archaeon]
QLSMAERERLYDQILKIAKAEVICISAQEIDELRKIKSLNVIELDAFIEIIQRLSGDKVIIDLPESGNRFEAQIKSRVGREIELTAEHKADENYPVVSAASIIAKVTRDREVRRIEEELGTRIGSGYPSDPDTKKYLKDVAEGGKGFGVYVRHSWQTVKNFVNKKEQKDLFGF